LNHAPLGRDHLQLLRGGELRCAERPGDVALEAGSVWYAVTSVMKLGGSHD
jgi:hypothetical protein